MAGRHSGHGGQHKRQGNPTDVPAKKSGGANPVDRTACSECQQVQGRHTSTCSRRAK